MSRSADPSRNINGQTVWRGKVWQSTLHQLKEQRCFKPLPKSRLAQTIALAVEEFEQQFSTVVRPRQATLLGHLSEVHAEKIKTEKIRDRSDGASLVEPKNEEGASSSEDEDDAATSTASVAPPPIPQPPAIPPSNPQRMSAAVTDLPEVATSSGDAVDEPPLPEVLPVEPAPAAGQGETVESAAPASGKEDGSAEEDKAAIEVEDCRGTVGTYPGDFLNLADPEASEDEDEGDHPDLSASDVSDVDEVIDGSDGADAGGTEGGDGSSSVREGEVDAGRQGGDAGGPTIAVDPVELPPAPPSSDEGVRRQRALSHALATTAGRATASRRLSGIASDEEDVDRSEVSQTSSASVGGSGNAACSSTHSCSTRSSSCGGGGGSIAGCRTSAEATGAFEEPAPDTVRASSGGEEGEVVEEEVDVAELGRRRAESTSLGEEILRARQRRGIEKSSPSLPCSPRAS